MTTEQLARAVLRACEERGIMLATAESCTGGMIAASLTDIAGSSTAFERGFVTYSNEAKIDMLGIDPATLETHGAVSRETALAMAIGALAHSRAGIAVSVTGIAGPGGGTAEKPVGTVWFGIALDGKESAAELRTFENRGRHHIRWEAVRTVLYLVLRVLKSS